MMERDLQGLTRGPSSCRNSCAIDSISRSRWPARAGVVGARAAALVEDEH